MALSDELISQFAKITKTEEKSKDESTVYGTIVLHNSKKYVKLDGSELLTPVASTTNIEPDERVTVMIKNHTATVTGNISSPAARTQEVEKIGTAISEFEIIIAGKVDTIEFNAQVGRIDSLVSDNVTIKEKLTAAEADITNLEADNATIKGQLTALDADITNLETENATITGKLTAIDADIGSLQADNVLIKENLTAHTADITKLKADNVDISGKLTAAQADIETLKTDKLSATEADLKYANIDFSNIGKAAIETFYAKSGIIKDLVIENGAVISGELIGVTIKGDLIEGGTVVADKLVVKGSDGLYYKLNTDGVTIEAEQTEYNSLNGSIITAKSITATKISVSDLVAFDATIGGFKITENSIYSGVKESADNTTKGIYLDNDGQIAFGDQKNFIRYYKQSDGSYKLEISAATVSISSSNKTIEDALSDIQGDVDNLRNEITTFVSITGVVNHYLASSASTDVTTSTPGWTTTMQSTDTIKKYLWSYQTINYSNDTTSDTAPVIIGTHGATGAKGDAGADAVTLTITSSNGTVFKNGSGSTVLTAHVWVGSIEQMISDAGVCGSIGSIKWYKSGSTTAVATAKTLTVSTNDVPNSQVYTCQLEG